MDRRLVVPARYRGPVTSGNGGWVAGALASYLDGAAAVQVRLSAPPPLDVLLDVVPDPDGAVRLLDGDTLLARAQQVDDDPAPVPPVPFAVALAAGASYPAPGEHPYPSCFVCSPTPPEGAGLRLATGRVDPPDGTSAAAWVPHPAFDAGDGQVTAAVAWAALDCPGVWSLDSLGSRGLPDAVPVLLGTITARLRRRPRIGERCVVRAAVDVPITAGSRTGRTRTTLYGEDGVGGVDGEPLGLAAHVWVLLRTAEAGG